MALTIPNVFIAGGQRDAEDLDENNVAIRDYINNREVSTGTFAARPAFGTAGRWYVATDVGGGTLYVDTGSAWVQVAASVVGAQAQLPRGYLVGFAVSNNGSDATNDLDIAVGKARNDDDTEDIILESALTKRLDATWVVGNNEGGLDTGSIADTTYHVFAIKRPDTGVEDVLFSASASSPTMPTNYTKKRRIFSFQRVGGAIQLFTQRGDDVELTTPVVDISNTAVGASADAVLASVPNGIVVEAHVNLAVMRASGAALLYARPKTATDANPVGGAGAIASPGATVGLGSNTTTNSIHGVARIYTNTAQTIRVSAATSTCTVNTTTLGWTDRRGRDG
jgi:hypothetical protein